MRNASRSFIFVIVLTVFFALSTAAQVTVPGEVVDVVNGKTVVVAITAGRVTVELQYIDVPTEGAMSETVKTHLKRMVMGKRITYRPTMISFDRTVGQLMMDNIDISQQLLRDGAAWHTPAELSGQERRASEVYASFESAAKNEKRGLWGTTLKPAWEMSAEDYAKSAVPSTKALTEEVPRSGKWSDKNPKLGNVGALLQGYNAETRLGWVSTSLLPVSDMRPEPDLNLKMALDITYVYKEQAKGRTGTFVITLVSNATKPQFQTNNSLMLVEDSGSSRISTARRTVSKGDGQVRENLRYEISRSAMSRIVNNPTMYLKIGEHTIFIFWGKYLLYNMLQVSE